MLLSLTWLATAAAAAAASLPAIPLIKPDNLTAHQSTQGGFIVQLKPDAPSTTVLKRGATPHERFHKRAAQGLDYVVRTEFTNKGLFYGVSIQLGQNKTTAEVARVLGDIPEVQAVWPIRMVAKPAPAAVGNFSAFAAAKTEGVKGRWAPVDNSPKLPVVQGANVGSTLKMAEVDKLHAKGIKGKGIKIGVIDTGEYISRHHRHIV